MGLTFRQAAKAARTAAQAVGKKSGGTHSWHPHTPLPPARPTAPHTAEVVKMAALILFCLPFCLLQRAATVQIAHRHCPCLDKKGKTGLENF